MIACVAVGGTSAYVGQVDGWYAALAKPYWTPPGATFGIVWTVLYVVMGVAVWLVLDRGWRSPGVRLAVVAFAIQLALNAAWSPIFFGGHAIGGAMAVIVALWFAIGWTMAAFWDVRDVAAVLLLPYWLWVTFAVALNAAIWRMN